MIYRVTHKTCYGYADAVPLSHNLVRMQPREHSAQTCRWHELVISPCASGPLRTPGLFRQSRFVVELAGAPLGIDHRGDQRSGSPAWSCGPTVAQAAPWEQVGQTMLGASDPSVDCRATIRL